MAQVESVDWDAKRIFLHLDTVTNGFDVWEAVREIKIIQAANTSVSQNYKLPVSREGKVPKGGGRFTPRYVNTLSGWRYVPYDQVDHRLDLLVEIVSEEGASDRDVFDRSGILVEVDIDAIYQQNEVIVIGGGVVDANIVQVNSIPVQGTGTQQDPWGP